MYVIISVTLFCFALLTITSLVETDPEGVGGGYYSHKVIQPWFLLATVHTQHKGGNISLNFQSCVHDTNT